MNSGLSHLSSVSLLLAALLAAPALYLSRADQPLPVSQRTNGSETLAAVKSLPASMANSVVSILGDTSLILPPPSKKPRGKATDQPPPEKVMRGVLVGAPGYFITKATEVPSGNSLRVLWTDGSTQTARIIRREPSLDILLAHAPTATGQPITWTTSSKVSRGQWLCAPVENASSPGWTMRLGVFSANRRPVVGKGAALGVTMEENEPTLPGVRIVQVASESPAERAGIVRDDVLVTLDGHAVIGLDSVREIIRTCQAGQEVRVGLRRGSSVRELVLRLASKTKVIANWDGEDYGNGGVSLRTDSYPQIIQHDIPLSPSDMGTPVMDILGNPVALNIARVDRVTTFALPSELFTAKVQQWIEADLRQIAAPSPSPAEPRDITIKRAIPVPAQ